MESQNTKFEGSAQDEQISKMLGGLKRVDAPGDFDHRVRGRIASGRPEPQATSWFPTWVPVAVPLVLVLLVGGYFAFNAFNSPTVPVVDQAKSIEKAPVTAPAPSDITGPSASDERAGTIEQKPNGTGNSDLGIAPEKKISSSAPNAERQGAGSLDYSFPASRNIYPRGLNPDRSVVVKPKDLERNSPISIKEVFSLIGVEARYSRRSWTIGTVLPDSVAERSGVKTGDVIEAVNEQTLTKKASFGSKFEGKSLRLRRDGKSITVELKP